MENSGRQKFEESWKEAFEDSEMEPSGLVWNNIEHKLDNDKMKRSVLFYQRLAAAAVIFALLIGVASTSYFQSNRKTQLASKTNSETTTSDQAKQKEQQELANNNETKSSVNNDKDNKEQQELIAGGQSGNKRNLDKESSPDNKKQTQDVNVDQNTKQNQSIAQANKKKNKQSDSKSNSSSTKSSLNSARENELIAQSKNSTSSNSSVASAKTNTSYVKSNSLKESNAIHNSKVNNNNDHPLIAKGDSKKGNDTQSIITDNSLNTIASVSENKNGKASPGNIQSADNAYSKMASYFSPQLKNNKLFKGMEPEPIRELPAMPASLMASSKTDRHNSNENSWLSFGAAAGSYNPGDAPSYSQSPASLQQYASASISNAMAPQNTSRSSVGSAYSLGFSFGKKLADRWILQTGVNYMNQSISYTSSYTTYSAANRSEAFVGDYADKTSAPVAITQPYKVNSVSDFVSVPVQAGYLIVDRKFGLQWNAGVATDVFLRNTLKDQSGRSDKYTQGSGDDSPYRSFNFAALTSTEFSYKLGGQYRVSLVPGVRYSFQSVLKSQSGAASNPLVLDIGFRFRYIFNTK